MFGAKLATWVGVAAALILSFPAQAQLDWHGSSPARLAAARQTLDRWTSPTLQRFDGASDFRRFLSDASAAEAARPFEEDQTIVITEPRYAPLLPEILGGAPPGVQAGDLVGEIGRFLLLLRDGRLYVADTGRAAGAPLRLVGRTDVHSRPVDSTLFDEMMIHDNRIVVLGYSGWTLLVRIVVFRLRGDGRLVREGDFVTPSRDGYDASLVGDRLVLHTEMELDDDVRHFPWPLIRRWPDREWQWSSDGERDQPLPPSRTIYRPVVSGRFPAVHSVLICRIGGDSDAEDLACDGAAFAGTNNAHFTVSETDAVLHLREGSQFTPRLDPDCPAPPWSRSIFYRIPLDGSSPTLLGVDGAPLDFDGFEARGGRLRALIDRTPLCGDGPSPAPLYLDLPLSDFSARLRFVEPEAYAAAPDLCCGDPLVRFTPAQSIVAERGFHDEANVAIVPRESPGGARAILVPHEISQADPVGDAILLAGAGEDGDLRLSLLSVEGSGPASMLRLPGRHQDAVYPAASRIDSGHAGLIGIPTRSRSDEAVRRSFEAPAPDISFLSLDPSGRLQWLGDLAARLPTQLLEERECVASCGSWAGASRAIFAGDRVFAVSGAELIEGRIEDGRIREVQRLNLLGPQRH